MQTRKVEIWVGIFVTVGFVALFVLSMKVSHLGSFRSDKGYTIQAKFQNIGGLKVKSPIKMSGVRIGRVSEIAFDDTRFQAIVSMQIDPQFAKIPTDTTASIFTAGLLGEQYISLEPGGEEEYLAEGDELDLTQSAVILEQLIGQFLLKAASDTKE
jgi:phospholipid/cholesterol/gamma-HCH transport system substrate-binding protein